VVKALPAGTDRAVIDSVFAEFKAYYDGHCNVSTLPFPGIPELLTALKAAGLKVAVNSNKLDANSRELIEAHFSPLVDMAIGDREGVPRKPAPDAILYLMKKYALAPAQCYYVGDRSLDMEAARNASIGGILLLVPGSPTAPSGYESHVARDLSELCKLFGA
jgi:phosphoglycolate phosphatase